MLCCLPFLYKPKAVAVLSVEVPQRLPQASQASQASQPSQPLLQAPQEIPVKRDEDPTSESDDVPRVLRIRSLRIPDALMNIRNPSIKAQFKEFCKENTLCVACSYINPENPTVLVFNGVLYECPHCDSDAESP